MKSHRFDAISFISGLVAAIIGLVFLVPQNPGRLDRCGDLARSVVLAGSPARHRTCGPGSGVRDQVGRGCGIHPCARLGSGRRTRLDRLLDEPGLEISKASGHRHVIYVGVDQTLHPWVETLEVRHPALSRLGHNGRVIRGCREGYRLQ